MLVFKANVKACVVDKEFSEITSVFKHELSEIEIKTAKHVLKGSGLKLILDEKNLNKSFSVKTKKGFEVLVDYDPRLGKVLDWKDMKKEKLEVKFKEGVYGFIFDSCDDSIVQVFKKPMTETELKLIREVIGDDDCIFTDIKEVNEVFDIDMDSLYEDIDGLGTVLEYVE